MDKCCLSTYFMDHALTLLFHYSVLHTMQFFFAWGFSMKKMWISVFSKGKKKQTKKTILNKNTIEIKHLRFHSQWQNWILFFLWIIRMSYCQMEKKNYRPCHIQMNVLWVLGAWRHKKSLFGRMHEISEKIKHDWVDTQAHTNKIDCHWIDEVILLW